MQKEPIKRSARHYFVGNLTKEDWDSWRKFNEYQGRPLVFVFGSNEEGIHKSGAAAFALSYCKAIYGHGEGIQGDSYALPTKSNPWLTLSLDEIRSYVETFLGHAKNYSGCDFIVTKVGCGLAKLESKDIAPMFKDAPFNCFMPMEWKEFLE